MRTMLSLALAACILSLLGCRQSTPKAAATLEKELLSVFTKYTQACISGDVAGFRSLRDPTEIKRLEKILLERGKTISPESVKPRKPENLQRILSYPIIQTIQQDNLSRLAFFNEDASLMGHAKTEAEIILVLFKRQDTEWKVLRFGPMILPKAEVGLDEGFSEEKVPELFQLTDE